MTRTQDLDPWSEVLAALSLATDLANGHDYEKTLRTCVLAVGIAEVAGLSSGEIRDVFHATLLRFLGCSSYSHEEALLFDDDIAARRAFAEVDYGSKLALWRAAGDALGESAPLLRRGTALLGAPAKLRLLFASQCEVGMRLGARLSVDAGAVSALGQIHERWDGRGGPAGLAGEAIGAVVRVVQVANVAELAHRRLGLDAAVDVVRRRRSSAFAPDMCDVFTTHARDLIAPWQNGSAWDGFASLGARFPMIGPDHAIDHVIEVFADFADLATVFTLGHSRAVARTAVQAAERLGLSEHERIELRRAALLHDLGRVAVPTAIWEKRERLSVADWERIRLHAYYGRRILERAPSLRVIAELASSDHERADASGYPRAQRGAGSSLAAAVLAAADVHTALHEDRPHRNAMEPAAAAAELRREVAEGRLQAEAVDAVLGDMRPVASVSLPAGLTPREVEVLDLVARGQTNKEAAQRLGISPRTVGHHLAHAYEKIGVSTRAAAALFVVEHGLVRRRET